MTTPPDVNLIALQFLLIRNRAARAILEATDQTTIDALEDIRRMADEAQAKLDHEVKSFPADLTKPQH